MGSHLLSLPSASQPLKLLKTAEKRYGIDYIDDESLIPVEDLVVTLTNKGYIKRVERDTYKSQNRGGVGIKGMTTNEEDAVEHLINLSTHDYILFFTNKGKVYRLKGYEIPEFSRQSKGLPIINLIQVEKEEYISSVIKLDKEEANKYLLFATNSNWFTINPQFPLLRPFMLMITVVLRPNHLISTY